MDQKQSQKALIGCSSEEGPLGNGGLPQWAVLRKQHKGSGSE